jgi:hypothetical protein
MLTPQQIARYRDDGYTVRHEFLSRRAVDAILAGIEALTSTAPGRPVCLMGICGENDVTGR